MTGSATFAVEDVTLLSNWVSSFALACQVEDSYEPEVAGFAAVLYEPSEFAIAA